VEVGEFARITGASLTLPGSGDISSQRTESSPAQSSGLSKPFFTARIETMREILEWHAALKTPIERGYPLSDKWLGDFRRQIQSSLKHTEAVASTDLDQEEYPLLVNEFRNMEALTDRYLKTTGNRDYLAPDSLSNDPLEQKVWTCWHSMELMASSNEFAGHSACK
jgi:hypothetical protein